LEWQDRLSSSYARTDNLDLAGSHPSTSLLHVGDQPTLQRRRLETDAPVASDWDRLYKLEPVSESEESDDVASVLGELSLDENREVRPDLINM